MPNSLLDMFSPRDIGGQPTDLGAMLGQRSNSLIGLGLGLLGGSAQDPYGRALAGYSHGASSDQERYQAAQRLAEQRAARAASLAEHQADRAQAQSNFERTFARGDVTDAQRAMADVLGTNATPEQKAEFMKSYYANKTEQPGSWILKDIIDPNDPDGERKITVQEHNRTGQIRPPQLPGQGTAAVPANAFPTPGASGGGTPPVYGYGGDFSTTPGAVPAAAPPSRRLAPIAGATGITYQPPAGLSKEGRKAWENHVAATEAKIAAGEITMDQANASMYGGQMRIAEDLVRDVEDQGLGMTAKGLERLPWGAGNLFQSKDFQKYQSGKDAFINSKLRRQSGATIRDDEYYREEKIYFPQPGDDAQRIEYKRALRQDAIRRMEQAAGPGYTRPPAAPATAAPATAAPATPGGGNTPPPPPGFTIVR